MREIVKLIKNKTGLDVNVFCRGGLLAGTFPVPEDFLLPSDSDFSGGLYQDEKSGLTFFTAVFGFDNVVGALKAHGVPAKKIAALAAALIEQAGKQSGSQQCGRSGKLKQLISGEGSLSLADGFFNFREGGYYVYYLYSNTNYGSILNLASEMAQNVDIVAEMGEGAIAYFKYFGQADVFSGSKDFAEMLSDSIEQELLVRTSIGAGGAIMSPAEISPAFFRAAAAYRLGTTADPLKRVYEYKDYILHKIVDGLPREVIKDYYMQLADKGAQEILDDHELTATAEAFLSNSLNISETARLMYMHRNTLIYRIDKIEKATGLNIRIFSDAVTFKMLLFIHKTQSAPDKTGGGCR